MGSFEQEEIDRLVAQLDDRNEKLTRLRQEFTGMRRSKEAFEKTNDALMRAIEERLDKPTREAIYARMRELTAAG